MDHRRPLGAWTATSELTFINSSWFSSIMSPKHQVRGSGGKVSRTFVFVLGALIQIVPRMLRQDIDADAEGYQFGYER